MIEIKQIQDAKTVKSSI